MCSMCTYVCVGILCVRVCSLCMYVCMCGCVCNVQYVYVCMCGYIMCESVYVMCSMCTYVCVGISYYYKVFHTIKYCEFCE